MKHINKFETTDEYTQAIGGGGQLADLEHFIAYTVDTDSVHLKETEHKIVIKLLETPIHNISFIERLENGETVQTPIEDVEYKVKDAPYGFKIGYYEVVCSVLYNPINEIIFNNYDTSKVTDMSNMFEKCFNLTSLDLSSFNTSNVTNMSNMFYHCSKLTTLDLSNFDTSNVTNMSGMFLMCFYLTHIKCKQSFKDWCIENQDTIQLPTAMCDGGSGTWEIVE